MRDIDARTERDDNETIAEQHFYHLSSLNISASNFMYSNDHLPILDSSSKPTRGIATRAKGDDKEVIAWNHVYLITL